MRDEKELARLMLAILSQSKNWELRKNDILNGYHFIVNGEILIDSLHAAVIDRVVQDVNTKQKGKI